MLLLCQIVIMTSYPVVNEEEQIQDVFYRDNTNSGVILEENALQHHAGSSEQRNGTLSSFLSLLPEHKRVAREPHPCVDSSKSYVVYTCDNGETLTKVFCRKDSHGCNHRDGRCAKKLSMEKVKKLLQAANAFNNIAHFM